MDIHKTDIWLMLCVCCVPSSSAVVTIWQVRHRFNSTQMRYLPPWGPCKVPIYNESCRTQTSYTIWLQIIINITATTNNCRIAVQHLQNIIAVLMSSQLQISRIVIDSLHSVEKHLHHYLV